MAEQNRVPLAGSDKLPVADAEQVGELHPDERLEVTVRVRRQQRLPDGSTFRGFEGEISVPTDLQGIVQGVFGLDTRPVARRDC